MNKKKLETVRKKLDLLDDQMLKIIKKRTVLVKKIMKIKSQKNQIVDKVRINKILKRIKRKSVRKRLDPRITQRIWKNMIWSFINYEKRNFKKK